MALPKGKAMALLAIFAAIGLVTATGAFTTVTATRTADVSVSGDGSALLALAPASGPNGQYASNTGNPGGNVLVIDLGDVGVNDEAVTDIQGVFTITNNGNQNVNVSISDRDTVNGNDEDPGEDDMVTFYNASYQDAVSSGVTDQYNLEVTSVELSPGSTLTVSIYIDTNNFDDNDQGENDLVDEITINADQTEESTS